MTNIHNKWRADGADAHAQMRTCRACTRLSTFLQRKLGRDALAYIRSMSQGAKPQFSRDVKEDARVRPCGMYFIFSTISVGCRPMDLQLPKSNSDIKHMAACMGPNTIGKISIPGHCSRGASTCFVLYAHDLLFRRIQLKGGDGAR